MMLPIHSARGISVVGECYHGRNYCGREPIPQHRATRLVPDLPSQRRTGDQGRSSPRAAGQCDPALVERRRRFARREHSPALGELQDRVRSSPSAGREPFALKARVSTMFPPSRDAPFALSRFGEHRSVCVGSLSGAARRLAC